MLIASANLLAVFSAGNIVFIILETYHYIAQLAYDCDAKTYGWTFIIRLIFTICQTLFFFRGTKAKVEPIIYCY